MSRRASASPPVALTIAGSDNSCGAGIQADLKTFGAFGVYGLTAVTCVVSEIPGKVEMVRAMPPALLRSQIRIDPVMVASSGDPLLKKDAVRAYEEELLPLADVITPNLDEAAVLLGRKIKTRRAMIPAAQELREKYGAAVLLKGGHLRGRDAVDVLCDRRGTREFVMRRLSGFETHGSGCSLSAALAAGLARGRSLPAAVEGAKKFLHRAIGRQLEWRRGKVTTRALRHQ